MLRLAARAPCRSGPVTSTLGRTTECFRAVATPLPSTRTLSVLHMGQQVYKTPRVTDEQIHRALIELGKEFGPFNVGVQVTDASVGQIAYPEANDPGLETVLAQQSELINHFGTSIRGVNFAYYRGGAQGQIWEKSPIYDDLVIDTQGFDQEKIKVVARAISLFRPVQVPRPADPISLLDAQRALQEASFSRLQTQLEKVFQQTIDLRTQLDSQVQAKEAALLDEFKQRQTKAEEELQAKVDELARREATLDERRKSLDESDNTFARRQIRDRMLSDVAERVQNFGLSDATVQARRPVAFGMALLAAFLLSLLLLTSFELILSRGDGIRSTQLSAPKPTGGSTSTPTPTSSPEPNSTVVSALGSSIATERILLWVRLSLLSLALAAAIVYYIRWQSQWANSFASTEQSLQQFHIDVNRANWVVETCLEWRKETDSNLPPTLIESLTRGLFAGRELPQSVLHPADELASALMGTASKLSLDLNGNKVEIDKPSKIPKSVPSSSGAPPTKGAA